MKKLFGIISLLVIVSVLTAIISDSFLLPSNIENLLRRTSLFALISIGAAFVIISGGIDLSIGSVVCLSGILLPWLLVQHEISPLPAILIVLLVSATIGWWHGFLITRLKLQPFIVTLCGLLLYRGIARGITGDQTQGFGLGYDGLRSIAVSRINFLGIIEIPSVLLVMLFVALIASVYLNRSVFGRYLFAVGSNEQAARYSGIRTDRVILSSYVICSTLAGIGGMLFVMDVNSAQPSDFGNFYELYAIAAAVLGGCSLRGGEGSVLGILLGAAIMQVLRNAIVLVDIPTQLEYAIIGGVILLGAIGDEVARSFGKRSS